MSLVTKEISGAAQRTSRIHEVHFNSQNRMYFLLVSASFLPGEVANKCASFLCRHLSQAASQDVSNPIPAGSLCNTCYFSEQVAALHVGKHIHSRAKIRTKDLVTDPPPPGQQNGTWRSSSICLQSHLACACPSCAASVFDEHSLSTGIITVSLSTRSAITK